MAEKGLGLGRTTEEIFTRTDQLFYCPSRSEYPVVAQRLYSAFSVYPEFGDADRVFLRSLLQLITNALGSASEGRIYSLSPELQEVALWFLSKKRASPYRIGVLFRFPGRLWLGFRFLWKLAFRANWEVLRENRRVEARIKGLQLPPVFLKLELLTVGSVHRGSGKVRELLTPLLEEARAAGVPVLLVTHTERNRQIYTHFGFETACYDDSGAAPAWIMIRSFH